MPSLMSLPKKYPLLFREFFYIECQDGWYDLIDKLSSELSSIIEKLEISEEDREDGKYQVNQVKEKWGILRFSIFYGNDEMWNLIDKAEEESKKICEICGKEGSLIKRDGWLMVRCKEC